MSFIPMRAVHTNSNMTSTRIAPLPHEITCVTGFAICSPNPWSRQFRNEFSDRRFYPLAPRRRLLTEHERADKKLPKIRDLIGKVKSTFWEAGEKGTKIGNLASDTNSKPLISWAGKLDSTFRLPSHKNRAWNSTFRLSQGDHKMRSVLIAMS